MPSPAAHGLAVCRPHVARPQPKPYDAGAGLSRALGGGGERAEPPGHLVPAAHPFQSVDSHDQPPHLQRCGTPKACLSQPAAAATCPEATQGRGSLGAPGVPRTGQVGPQRPTRHGGGKVRGRGGIVRGGKVSKRSNFAQGSYKVRVLYLTD